MSSFKWNEIPTDIDVTSARIRFFDIDKTVPSTSDDWTVSPAFSIGGIPADTGVPVKGIHRARDIHGSLRDFVDMVHRGKYEHGFSDRYCPPGRRH